MPAKKRPDTRTKERPRIRLHIGDTVEVITGKDVGQRGQVTEIIRDQQRVRVNGVALITKHQRAGGRSRAMQRQAGRIQMPGTIHVSNVMVVCPTCGKRNRPRYEGEGAANKSRICRNCGAAMPRPTAEE
jgi:large subunit ribosomal protein L24